MLEAIDARAARQWALTALAALAEVREELDALNVFPVPDGDTGTNLYLTFEAAVDATEEAIVNAMVAAETMTGSDGFRVYALPTDQVLALLRRAGRLK